jgi:hypothetical protein
LEETIAIDRTTSASLVALTKLEEKIAINRTMSASIGRSKKTGKRNCDQAHIECINQSL